MEWPLRAVCRSLGRLRGLLRNFSILQASKIAARELRLRNFLDTWQARKLGRDLTCTSRLFLAARFKGNVLPGSPNKLSVQFVSVIHVIVEPNKLEALNF